MIIVLIILLLLLISYCRNRNLKESYGYNRRYKKNYHIYNRYNPYRHYLRHRYYTGTYPQYYYPIYKTYPELNEENCRKYYPCEKKI